MSADLEPTFFTQPSEFEDWLEQHHQSESELIVGYYKKATGLPSMTWPESVDAALCFGWIDGIRRRIDEHAYCIRFTPRRPQSIWSAVNINRVEELTKEDRMRQAGVVAFERRTEAQSAVYSYETSPDRPTQFEAHFAKVLNANPKAATFFELQPPGYRKKCVHWVQSAKKMETRERRMNQLIAACEDGQRRF